MELNPAAVNTIEKMPLDALLELRNDCDSIMQKIALFPQFEKVRLSIIAVYPAILQQIDKRKAEAGPQYEGRLF